MKKTIVRMISLIIAVLVVAMSLPLGAFAASAPYVNGTLVTDNEAYIGYYYSEPMYYSFTPEETGFYLISSKGKMDTFVTVFDSDMAMLESDDDSGENGNFALSLKLQKNRLYYVKLGAYGSGDFTVTATLADEATSLVVCDSAGNTVESIYGHPNESLRYFGKFLPEGSVGDNIFWSIADTDIASVDSYGNVNFKTQGNTTLTATAGNLSVTVPVVTAAAIELVSGVENSIAIPSVGDHLCINFTVPETGDYKFVYNDLTGLDISVFTRSGEQYFAGEDISGGFEYGFNESCELIIKVDYSECTAETFTIKAERLIYTETANIFANVNGQKLYSEYYNVYAGETLQLGYDIFPEGSIERGETTFSSSNPDEISVTADGLVTVNTNTSATIYLTGYGFYDQIDIYGQAKNEIPLGGTYTYPLNQSNCATYIGTITIPEDSKNLKVVFSSTSELNLKILDEDGNLVTEREGTEGLIKQGLGSPYTYQVIVTSKNFSEDTYFTLTVKEYIPLEGVTIVDSEGADISEYNGKVGDCFTLYGKTSPEGVTNEFKWVSDNPEIAYVDDYGNVTIVNPGYTYIRAYALEEDGNIIEGFSDFVYIFGDRITDTYFWNSHLITIENYTEKLRVTAPHTGYYYALINGDDISLNMSVTNTADDSNITVRHGYISETEHRFSFYLESGKEYIFDFAGPYGNSYNVYLGVYDVPSRIYIIDTYGSEINTHSAYAGETAHFGFRYDFYNCFVEDVVWKSTNNSVATVDDYGNVNFLKEGNATITVTTETGLTAKLEVTVTEGTVLELDTPVTETLSYNGMGSTRFTFTPSVTAVYEISAVNTAGGEVHLNFVVLDSSYNEMNLLYNASTAASAKMEAGKTYIIKVYEQGQGGTYNFTLSNKTIGLNTPRVHTMPEGDNNYLNYYFIPEKDGFYLFKTSGYTDEGWGRGVDLFDESDSRVANFSIDGSSSVTYASLKAGTAYRASIFKNYWQSATFTFEITEAVGISSMEILTMPTDGTVSEGDTNFNFSGLSLKVTMSDSSVQTWNYDEAPDRICGFPFSYTYSEEIDGIRYAYIKAGGSVCEIPFTVKMLETLSLNTPVSVTLGMDSDEISYKFIPEHTGWYLFKSYNHTVISNDRNMSLSQEGMWVVGGQSNPYTTELYANLTAGECYVLNTYKYYYQNDEFTLSVTETVGIESLTVKQNPSNMTVTEGKLYDYDLSGLILTVTTSDGNTRDWTYTKGASNVFGYMFNVSYSTYEESVEYHLNVGGKTVTLIYEKKPYQLVSIEAITAGDITIVENTNGYYMTEETYYYHDYNYINKFKLKLNYADGTYKFASVYDEVDGFYVGYYDSQTEKPWVKDGENFFTVTFRDKTLEVPVKIIENTFQSMEVIDDGDFSVIEGMGTLSEYTDNEAKWYYQLDYSKIKIKINFTDGSSVIASPGEEVRGVYLECYESQFLNPIEAGKDNYITVTYGNETVDLPVELIENDIESVTLTKTPEKPYVYGDKAHGEFLGDGYRLSARMSDGYEFTVKYNDGRVVTVTDADLENDEYFGVQPSIGVIDEYAVIGQNKAIFAWGGTVIEFYIEVVESDVASIEVLETPKVPENLEYFPDMVGLKLLINYTDGTTKTVTLTEDDINYNGDRNIIYYADVDGETFNIIAYGNGEYRVEHKAVTVDFTLKNVSDFYTYNITPLDFDKVNKTVTIGFVYNKNGAESYKTLQIDLSNNSQYEYDNGASYYGFVKDKKGIFTYAFSYTLYPDSGLLEYHMQLLNGNADGYLVDSAGDINGDFKIDARDLVRLKKLIAKMDAEAAYSADFDGDGNETATDLTLLRKYLLGEVSLSVVYGDADGNGYLDYNDGLTIAMYLKGSDELLSSRADVNLDGIIDEKDIDLINANL